MFGEPQNQTMFMGDDTDELTYYFGWDKYQKETRVDEVRGQRIQKETRVDDDKGQRIDLDAGFTFALNYLSVKDLLSVEMVCKSLQQTIRDDVLIWQSIHVDYRLCDKISNDILLQLTNRAQCSLSSLSLEGCTQITNGGLRYVLQNNPRLTKLSVPGCRIKLEGIFQDLKAFNYVSVPGIKCLRIGDSYGMTNEMFNEFKCLLGVDETKRSTNYKPRYYRASQLYLPLDDERAIDVETCPICKKVRQVYDCVIKKCQVEVEDGSTKPCRACTSCISRCKTCGCCLGKKVCKETFSLHLLYSSTCYARTVSDTSFAVTKI